MPGLRLAGPACRVGGAQVPVCDSFGGLHLDQCFLLFSGDASLAVCVCEWRSDARKSLCVSPSERMWVLRVPQKESGSGGWAESTDRVAR